MNIILNGSFGHMGREVAAFVATTDHTIVANVDKMATDSSAYSSFADVTEQADVIVDFSHHLGTKELLDFAVTKKIPVVIATTGHTEEELALIKEASTKIPVFHSANMSLGVALLVDLAKKTAALMPDADIEIVETHHNRKLDAPSGTALMIANAIKTVRNSAIFNMGRSGNAKRQPNEIGISAVRRGNIVGIHEVLVSTNSQTITLKHEAHSRALFAEGAISAASFLLGKPAGLYNMDNLVGGD